MKCAVYTDYSEVDFHDWDLSQASSPACLTQAAAAAKKASAQGQGNGTGDERPSSMRVKTNDVTDSDCSTVKTLIKFPPLRRLKVVTLEPDDDICEKMGHMISKQEAFILRPKRGKNLLKLMHAAGLGQVL